MNPILESNMIPPSPFFASDGGINVKDLAKTIELDQKTVVSASGVSRQVASQQFNTKKKFIKVRSKKAKEFWVKLNQIYSLLLALIDDEDSSTKIRDWFNSPNLSLSMERPIDLVRRGELDIIIKKLMDVFTAAHGG